MRKRLGSIALGVGLLLLIGSAHQASAACRHLPGQSDLTCDSTGGYLHGGLPQPVDDDGGHPLPVAPSLNGSFTSPASSITLPASPSAYTGTSAAPQLMANSATAGSITAPSFSIANSGGRSIVPRLDMSTNASSGWGGVLLVITLWSAAPTYTNGDGGVYAVATAPRLLGQYSCTLIQFGNNAQCNASPFVGTAPMAVPAAGALVYWDAQIQSSATKVGSQTVSITPEIWN